MDNAERKYIDAEQLKDVLIISKNMISNKMQLFGNENDAIITQAFNCGIDAAVQAIDGLQAADVKTVNRGRWKAHGDCGVTECSVCGWNIEEYIEFNYCPECGADMC